MPRWIVVIVTLLLVVVVAAVLTDRVARYLWERHVWACYGALASGKPLPQRFLLPAQCTCATRLVVIDNLGAPNAAVVLGFDVPRSVWSSYWFGTSSFDAYAIEIQVRNGATRATIHHGSD